MNEDSSFSINRQLAKFNELWIEACDSWPPAGFTMDTNSKLTWTITGSPKSEHWHEVTKVITEFSNRWPWNVPYTMPQLHVTVTGLGKPYYWKDRESDLRSILKQSIANLGPIEISIRGLNLLRNTIVVQIIDNQDKLRRLVNDLSQSIKVIDPAQDFRPGIHNEVWWTSIARLYKPVPDELLTFIDGFRDTDFGSGLIESVRLIETTKGFDLSKTRVIYDCHIK